MTSSSTEINEIIDLDSISWDSLGSSELTISGVDSVSAQWKQPYPQIISVESEELTFAIKGEQVSFNIHELRALKKFLEKEYPECYI